MNLSRRHLFAVTPSLLTAAALPVAADTAAPEVPPPSAFEARRAQLEGIAWQRLEATQHNEEQWSFLFRTEGSYGYGFIPWSHAESQPFDQDFHGLNLSWPSRRIWELEEGLADLTAEELTEWQRARCIHEAQHGSDLIQPAWIVPLRFGAEIHGWALFLCGLYADDEPMLEGVFETAVEAEVALAEAGAVDVS